MNSILVTGASGTIGRILVSKLRASEVTVYTIDRHAGDEFNFNYDITKTDFGNIINECAVDTVIHLAGNVDVADSWRDPISDLSINVVGTLRLLQSIRDTEVRNFVYLNSGGAIYGESSVAHNECEACLPSSPYGVSKLVAEHYIRIFAEKCGISWTSLAVSNVFGPYESIRKGVVYEFMSSLLNGNPAVIFGAKTTRDFVHISDVIQAIKLVIQNPANCRINISSGIETNLVDLFTFMQSKCSNPTPYKILELPQGHVTRSCLDNSKAREIIGWFPKVSLTNWLSEELKRIA